MGRSGYTCVRHVFCLINVTLWLAGCGLLGVGLWLRLAQPWEGSPSPTIVPQITPLGADILLMTFGMMAFVVAFFGCCGSWFQSRWMLITYFSLVILVFLIELGVATICFVYRGDVSELMKEELKRGIELNYNTTPNTGLEAIWERIQTEFECCGVSSHEDWYDINAWRGKMYVPDSCCLPAYRNETGCGQSTGTIEPDGANPDKWHSKGCFEKVSMWFVERLHLVGAVGLVIAFLQLFGLVSSMLLFCTVRHKRQSHTYKSYDPTKWLLNDREDRRNQPL